MKVEVDPIRLRTIKSYVCRSRMTAKQRLSFDNYWSIYGIQDNLQPINLGELFNRNAPTYLEIGFGMGQSLLAMAAANSNMNFIGVEVHRPGIGNLLAIAHEKGLTNIRVFSGDALSFMSNCLPDVSINGVLLFFPDPWPKKRHHKRRIVQPAFLDLVARKLVSGGYFHTATDVMGYADHMIQVAKSHPHFHNQVGLDWPAIIERPKTKFESRGEDLGHTITDLVFIKE